MNAKFNYGAVFKVTRRDSIADIEVAFKKMADSGFNTVVLWPAFFWWEEKSDLYPFKTGLAILDVAQKFGLKVVMELAGQLPNMEYAPDFLMKKEYYAVDENGNVEFAQGSFGFLNYFHPEVGELVKKQFTLAANAYKDHPALLAYDAFNETMFRSFDNYTLGEFRAWLKEKYGTINKLNDVWEHSYSTFEEINFEKWKWMSIKPITDYKAFRRESVSSIVSDWYSAIKNADPNHPVMADNVYAQASALGLYFRPQDDFGLKKAVDEIGMSFYPKQKNGTFSPALRWQICDGFYSATEDEGFWLAEMQTHNRDFLSPTTCVEAAELKQWCMEAYAAGAKSLMYWMWRPFDSGLQTLGRGLVNYKGEDTERLTAATELSKIFGEYGVIKPLRSNVGIVYDPSCEDSVRAVSGVPDLEQNYYSLSLFGAYEAFFEGNLRCDIITPDKIYNYKAIILSNHVVIDDDFAKALVKYVEDGGVVISDGFTGYLNDSFFLNSVIPGGASNCIFGNELFDFDNHPSQFALDGLQLMGYNGRIQCNLTNGVVVAAFGDGMPAVVECSYGKGRVLSFCTSVWYSADEDVFDREAAVKLAKLISERYELTQIYANQKLKIRIAQNSDEYLIFAFNYGKSFENGEIFSPGITVAPITIEVAPGDYKIIRIKRG